MLRTRKIAMLLLAASLGLAGACSPSDTSKESKPAPASAPQSAPVPVSPAASAEVAAEQGGPGFTGEGWQTNTKFNLIGDPRAVKGGVFREHILDFPATFRMAGPDSSTNTNFLLGDFIYETLLAVDPTSLDYIPSLATHWQISKDKLTFRFRINPDARFSNGEPVTADDVIASWSLITDKTLKDPSRNAQFARFAKPVAESRQIVSVKVSKADWRNLKDFATSLLVYPASSLKDLTGAQYLQKYNYAYLPGTGPYSIGPADVQKDKSITVRRRKDYWAEKERRNTGLNNFDEVKLIVVKDPQALPVEMLKKGDLDFLFVNRTVWWLKDLNSDNLERGLIQKRKVYNNTPLAMNGLAINTRRPPLDDIRVRKALTLLVDRQKIIEQLYSNEYVPLNTYFPGTEFENPENPKNLYNPQEAFKLLEAAGWKDHDAQGRLMRDGKPLVLQVVHDVGQERPLSVYQEDLRKVGITLELNGVPFETGVQLVRRDRRFDLAYRGLGFSAFPDPEQNWHSRLADVGDNNNFTGLKGAAMDDLMAKYAASFDQKEHVDLLRQLDAVLVNQYHYVLFWTAPAERLAFWNKFGQPKGYLTRIGDFNGDLGLGPGVERLWWLDPEKEKQLKKAQADTSIKLDVGPLEDKYWLSYKELPNPR